MGNDVNSAIQAIPITFITLLHWSIILKSRNLLLSKKLYKILVLLSLQNKLFEKLLFL